MGKFLNRVFLEPFKDFLEKIVEFLPNIFTSLVLILSGLVLAWLLKALIIWIARFLRIDAISERIGVLQALQKGGIKDPLSRLVGRLVYWVLVISFIIMGLNALGVPAVEELLSRFFLYLPNLILAGVVMVLGYIVGNFLGRAALIASVNAGLRISGLVGRLVNFMVFVIALSMAAELLGIGKDTVLVAFALVFGGIVLALSIAFGLGGKDIAKDYIEKKLGEKEEKDQIKHI